MTTRDTKALEALIVSTAAVVAAIESGQIASQNTISGPLSADLTTASQVVVSGNGSRLVVVTNQGIQDAYFAYGQDAIEGAGIVVSKDGGQFTFPLAQGVSLHGVTAMAMTSIAFLFFG